MGYGPTCADIDPAPAGRHVGGWHPGSRGVVTDPYPDYRHARVAWGIAMRS